LSGRRRCLAGSLIGLALVCVLSGPFLVIAEEAQPADAIVVIGGDHKPERVRRAVELDHQGLAPVVIVSGGTVVQEGDEWLPEAELMQRLALGMGLEQEAMILETRSLTTAQNAAFAEEICRAEGITSVLLVTSAYHSRRARRVFRDEMEPDISVTVQPAAQDFCPLCWVFYPSEATVILYEYWNWAGYWLTRLGVRAGG